MRGRTPQEQKDVDGIEARVSIATLQAIFGSSATRLPFPGPGNLCDSRSLEWAPSRFAIFLNPAAAARTHGYVAASQGAVVRGVSAVCQSMEKV